MDRLMSRILLILILIGALAITILALVSTRYGYRAEELRGIGGGGGTFTTRIERWKGQGEEMHWLERGAGLVKGKREKTCLNNSFTISVKPRFIVMMTEANIK